MIKVPYTENGTCNLEMTPHKKHGKKRVEEMVRT